MQVFEIIELKEFPYMATIELANFPENTLVSDVIQMENSEKVYIIIDHNLKRIWNYNGLASTFKLQIYGGIVAGMFRKQLKLFYRIFSLNAYSTEDKNFKDIINHPLLPGIAKDITENDFIQTTQANIIPEEISIHVGVDVQHALEDINNIPIPKDFTRKFFITGNNIYSDENIIDTFFSEIKTQKKQIKLGRLNDGFTFFGDNQYSLRLIIKKRCVQGIELFLHKEKEKEAYKIDLPVLYEERFNKSQDIENLKKAFQIPE